jgi:hypothetical protein
VLECLNKLTYCPTFVHCWTIPNTEECLRVSPRLIHSKVACPLPFQ